MSGVALFLFGAGVTIVVAAAVGVLAYAAVLDGRYEREMRERMRSGRPDDRYDSSRELVRS